MALPALYVDNVSITRANTQVVRGNTVSDLSGNVVRGINIENTHNLRVKNNKVVRIRSKNNTATAYRIHNSNDCLLLYNVASRANVGYRLTSIAMLNVYNATAHNVQACFQSDSVGTYKNIALSTYQDNSFYKNSTGFVGLTAFGAPAGGFTVEYTYYTGLSAINSGGTYTPGSSVSEKSRILYLDESNDDLTPDYISELVNSGTTNPENEEDDADIGGLESPVTTSDITAQVSYWYELIDTVFWNTDDLDAPQVALIKAAQSRVLASAEVATAQIKNDTRIKFATSMERFAELYPMYARYANPSKFKKRVADMWFSGQNTAVVQSYQNGIGGYNLLPSFFKRMEDYEDGWIIAVSDVAYNNWLNGLWDLRYGIGIDVLGTSTISRSTSGECYENVMKSIADIAPVRWFLHDEVQPTNYIVFADMWNGYENCTLDNMIYTDDFSIALDDVDLETGEVITPPIPTDTILTSAATASSVEISLLDRVWSENVTRTFYYRQGGTQAETQAANWTEITDHIGGVLPLRIGYVQFKINVSEVTRRIDYEFIGLALRTYNSLRDWTRPQP